MPTTIAPPSQDTDALFTPAVAVEVIEAVLDAHHATTIAVGDGLYEWACRCGQRAPAGADPVDFATAWRAARHHAAEQVIETLKAAR